MRSQLRICFMNDDTDFPGGVTLTGLFDPATMAEFMAPEAAAQLAGIRSSPGVPLHRLAAALASRGIRTTLIGGVRDAAAIHVKSNPLSIAIYPKRGGWPFLWNGLRRERNAILTLLQEIHPSIVHAHWTFEGGRAVGDWDGPKLLTVHDAAWEYARLARPYGPASAAYIARWLANTAATLARFRHVIAVSPYVETYLRIRHRFRGTNSSDSQPDTGFAGGVHAVRLVPQDCRHNVRLPRKPARCEECAGCFVGLLPAGVEYAGLSTAGLWRRMGANRRGIQQASHRIQGGSSPSSVPQEPRGRG